jgi:hypothetical protein
VTTFVIGQHIAHSGAWLATFSRSTVVSARRYLPETRMFGPHMSI